MKPSERIQQLIEEALKQVPWWERPLIEKSIKYPVGAILDYLDEQHSKDGGK